MLLKLLISLPMLSFEPFLHSSNGRIDVQCIRGRQVIVSNRRQVGLLIIQNSNIFVFRHIIPSNVQRLSHVPVSYVISGSQTGRF